MPFQVNTDHPCFMVRSNVTDSAKIQISENHTNLMEVNQEKYPNMKWQYFTSKEGVDVTYPAQKKEGCVRKNGFRYQYKIDHIIVEGNIH